MTCPQTLRTMVGIADHVLCRVICHMICLFICLFLSQCIALAVLEDVARLGLPQLSLTKHAVSLCQYNKRADDFYFLEESVLRDLKALLMEAKQRVPPFLIQLDSLSDEYLELGDDKGCAYCGGLGHRITECPKLEAMQQKQAGSIGKKDYLAASAQDW